MFQTFIVALITSASHITSAVLAFSSHITLGKHSNKATESAGLSWKQKLPPHNSRMFECWREISETSIRNYSREWKIFQFHSHQKLQCKRQSFDLLVPLKHFAEAFEGKTFSESFFIAVLCVFSWSQIEWMRVGQRNLSDTQSSGGANFKLVLIFFFTWNPGQLSKASKISESVHKALTKWWLGWVGFSMLEKN